MYSIIKRVKISRISHGALSAALLAFLLAIMILWRLVLKASSSRYWVALLIPMLLLIGYFIYRKWPGIRIARLILGIVIGVYIVRDLQLNWNNRAITNAAEVIVTDAQKYENPFCSEIEKSEILSRIGYYTPIPVLPYEKGMQLEMLLDSAKGLHDICYIVTMENKKDRMIFLEKMKRVNAELIFSQDKDMRQKKEICVYKVAIDKQDKKLPIVGELWPNGDFENVVMRVGRGPFPKYYDNIFNVSLSDKEVISGNYSLYSKCAGLSFVYSSLVPPLASNAMILFTVGKAPKARVRFYIWKFDKKGQFLSRKIMMNAVFPGDERTHQFQIPFCAKDFEDAAMIQCYWYLSAPRGLLLDDFGIYR